MGFRRFSTFRSMLLRHALASRFLVILLCSENSLSAQPPMFGAGGPFSEEKKIVKQFDTDKSGWLDAEERRLARAFLREDSKNTGRGGSGLPSFRLPEMESRRPNAAAGDRVEKSSVEPLTADLYANTVLRTIFIDFEGGDWEAELEEFRSSDVDVTATLTVDGQSFPNCGVHFRGMSSYFMVPTGYKRSLNVSLDLADKDQRLLGYKTLNLNSNPADASFMSSVLYSHIARQYMPAPKANFVRVVINGENWGVYSNVQQFNNDFTRENYASDKGARWKVSGSPFAKGGLDYRGDDPEKYESPYEQKSGGKKATLKLIEFCRVLNETPTEDLPSALEPMLDVSELLWFLAIDNALMNADGYWIRASDYSIYLDDTNKFHFLPHDMNEAFRPAGHGGPPGGGPFGGDGPFGAIFGPGGILGRGEGDKKATDASVDESVTAGGDRDNHSLVGLDPLVGMDDRSKPLRSKVLAVPRYRDQYLQNVRMIAEQALDWNRIGPFVVSQVALIDSPVKADTRKLGSYESFVESTESGHPKALLDVSSVARGGHASMNLKAFVDGRRAYLLEKTSVK